MKTTLLVILLITSNLSATEVYLEPKPKTPLEKLKEIQCDIQELGDDLRDDKHHKTIEIKLDDVDGKIDKLIEELESKEESERENQKQRDLVKSGKRDSSPGRNEPDESHRAILANPDLEDWAHLPPEKRGQISQAFNRFPARWALRIAAYFVSIAAEEGPTTKR